MGKKQENNEKIIRVQGAKKMFPCGRRIHLYKSASFKTIFGQSKKQMMLKLIPKLSFLSFFVFETIQKYYEKHREILPKYTKVFSILVPILEPFAWLFLGTSGGYALGSILTSPGAPFGPILPTFWKTLIEKIAPNFKDSRPTNGTNHTFKTNRYKHILKRTSEYTWLDLRKSSSINTHQKQQQTLVVTDRLVRMVTAAPTSLHRRYMYRHRYINGVGLPHYSSGLLHIS